MHRLAFSLLALLGLALWFPSPTWPQLVRGPEFLANAKHAGQQAHPDVAMAADGRFVVVWVDGGVRGAPSNVMARVFAADGTPRTGDIRVSVTEAGFQDQPAVAASADGSFVVVWRAKASAQAQSRVYGRLFDVHGRPIGQRFRLGIGYRFAQSEPDVARAPDGRFVVAWTERDGRYDPYGDPTTDVFARRFSVGGRPLGEEWTVLGGHLYQYAPAVAMNASGAFVIAVEELSASQAYDDWETDVYACLYAPDGSIQRFVTPDYTFFYGTNQSGPAVAIAGDGTFILAWGDSRSDESEDDDNYWRDVPGILVQQFDAQGNWTGTYLHVNATISDVQSEPAVASTQDGGFLVAWTSEGGQDGDGRGVYVRRFASDGSPLSLEAQLHTYTVGNQSEPSMAVALNGRGIVVWQSMRRDGDDFGVAARRVYLRPR